MSRENHNDAAPGSVAPETETDPFQGLLQRVRAGNQDAARLLYEEFTVDLITTIRDRYLPQTSRLRRLLDSGDLEQEVWFRVFQLLKRGKEFADVEYFQAYVYVVARNLYFQVYRGNLIVQMRSLLRQESFNLELHDRSATRISPADLVATEEEWRLALDDLPPVYRAVVIAIRNGETVAEVATRMDIKARHIQRIVQRFTQQWAKRLAEQGD